MKNSQEDKLSMYLKLKSTCEKFQSVWTANSAFKSTYDLFTSKITLIEQNRNIQITNITGITSDKAIKRAAMADKALYIANRIESFARVSENTELIANIHYTASDMHQARDTDIVGICELILSKANSNLDNLAGYDVTQEMLNDLEKAITAYTSVVTKPQTTKAILKNATQNIARYINEADKLLTTRLDLDIEVFKNTKSDFYSQYKTARIIINTGRQTTSLIVTVVDVNGIPVPKASAIITKDISSSKSKDIINEISKKTGVKGVFHIINLAEDNYKVTVNKIGYAEKTQTFSIVNGETTKLKFILQSISSPELQ